MAIYGSPPEKKDAKDEPKTHGDYDRIGPSMAVRRCLVDLRE